MVNQKRLIDAFKLEDLIQSNSARYHHVDDVIAAIARQPTVDAVEVVHGCTISAEQPKTVFLDRKCGICDSLMLSIDAYCPGCGAKMDGERKDNEV